MILNPHTTRSLPDLRTGIFGLGYCVLLLVVQISAGAQCQWLPTIPGPKGRNRGVAA
jgi:hypothetical protein